MSRATFYLSGGTGFCNAVRRSLLSDVETEAPCSVTMKTNTSCQTDEFLAHRIGLVPFRRVGNGDTMTLRADGPCTVTASMLTGPAFEPIHGDIELIQLGDGSQLDLEVLFDTKPARAHARYAPCAAVGMKEMDNNKEARRHAISFESNDHRTPQQLILSALDHVEARLQRALVALADDAPPPKSYC